MKRLSLWRYRISTVKPGYSLDAWDRDGYHFICLSLFQSPSVAYAEMQKMVKWNNSGILCCGSRDWCSGMDDIAPLRMSLRDLPPDELA